MPTYPQTHISNVVSEVLQRSGMKRRMKRSEVVMLWPQVAGPDLAAFTKATSLSLDGVLFVDVCDSETAMHLSFQRRKFLDVYKVRYGVQSVSDIRFKVGVIRQVPKATKPVLYDQADPKDLTRLAKILDELDLPSELEQRTIKAAKSLLKLQEYQKAQGYTPCVVCEHYCPKHVELCQVCQRNVALPKVKQQVTRLYLNPQARLPMLTDDERLAARYVTLQYLREHMMTLLPLCLSDPKHREVLERLSISYLALALDKGLEDVEDIDYIHVDSKVARILAKW